MPSSVRDLHNLEDKDERMQNAERTIVLPFWKYKERVDEDEATLEWIGMDFLPAEKEELCDDRF